MKNPLIRPQDISNKYNEVIARNSPEADDEAIPKGKIPSAPADPPGEDATPSLCSGLWLRKTRFFARCNLRMTEGEGLRMTSEGLGVIYR